MERGSRETVLGPAQAGGIVHRTVGWFSGLAEDVRLASRIIRRQPGYTLLAVITIGLGITATTLMFSVARGVLLRPLPWPGGERLVRLFETRSGATSALPPLMTNATFVPWKEHRSTLEDLGAYDSGQVTLAVDGRAERVVAGAITPNIFPMLGARPVAGSLFGLSDAASRDKALVISEALWRRWFGRDPRVIGRSVLLEGSDYQIIGVASREFGFPTPDVAVWIPYDVGSIAGGRNVDPASLRMFNAIGRLRRDTSCAQAAAEGTSRGRSGPDLGPAIAMAVFGSAGRVEVRVRPFIEAQTADVRTPILVFLAGGALLLLAATANIASLQLARATTRRREMALRAALGASGSRVARQLMVESACIGLAGGVCGVVAAKVMLRAAIGLLPEGFPRLDAIGIDPVVGAAAVGTSLLAGIALGILPARQVTQSDLVRPLGEDALAPAGGGLRTPTARARVLTMACQVAISCVLLVGAVSVTRSFVSLLRVDRGYDPAHVLTAHLPISSPAYTPSGRRELWTRLLERLDRMPGVDEVGLATALPLGGGDIMASYDTVSKRATGPGRVSVRFGLRYVSVGYFPALRVPLVQGRTFDSRDTATSQPVVVVNSAFARQYLGASPIGEQIPWPIRPGAGGADVIGVVEDERQGPAAAPGQPQIYLAYEQKPDGVDVVDTWVSIRSMMVPGQLAATLRRILAETDQTLAFDSILTMDQRVRGSLEQSRLFTALSLGFAILTLVIVGVGLFGVLAYSVAQRSREFGVRTALGATPASLLRLVARQAALMVGIGLAAGVASSLASVKVLSSLLFGVESQDALTFAAVVLVLLTTAALACLLPAYRASRVDPVQVLRR